MADPEPSARAADDPEDPERDAARTEGDSSADDGPKHGKKGRKGSFWRELPVLLLTALVLTFLIQTFLARVYVIPSASMEQTLHGCPGCSNDRVLVDKMTYRFTEPGPGDVVVFRGPASWGPNVDLAVDEPNLVVRGFRQVTSVFGMAPPDERDFVKRVIATEGQTVHCCDDDGRVVVDGTSLDEPYLNIDLDDNPQEEFQPVTVPDGHLWMMGDNRNNSADSRAHTDDSSNGAIPTDNVIGKARVIVLPPSRWGGVSDHNPQDGPQAMAASASEPVSAPMWQAAIPVGLSVLLVGGVRLGAGSVVQVRQVRQVRHRGRSR